jgi:glycine/sarcosine N-methyltransferase
MYDDFSNDYDRFVNWTGRLAHELPFIESQLELVAGSENRRLLDAACGTGMHAIALAQRGYTVTGTDFSAGMIQRARENALAQTVSVEFITAGFGQLAPLAGKGTFSAVLCLGNSLPHVRGPEELQAALEDFGACLHPGGLLLLQNRNFDLVLAQGERWMEPQAHQGSAEEWLFLRFYDYLPDGSIQFNIISLQRQSGNSWTQRIYSTRLFPLLQAEMTQALQAAGFAKIEAFGGLDGSAFDAAASGNLVISARKS